MRHNYLSLNISRSINTRQVMKLKGRYNKSMVFLSRSIHNGHNEHPLALVITVRVSLQRHRDVAESVGTERGKTPHHNGCQGTESNSCPDTNDLPEPLRVIYVPTPPPTHPPCPASCHRCSLKNNYIVNLIWIITMVTNATQT